MPFPARKTVFGKTWARSLLRRRSYSYRKIRGSKVLSVIDDNVLVDGDIAMAEVLKGYTPDRVLNYDESSLPYNVIGQRSWHKRGDTIPRKANEAQVKARFTISSIISKNGRKVI